jgi:hypothetical protein
VETPISQSSMGSKILNCNSSLIYLSLFCFDKESPLQWQKTPLQIRMKLDNELRFGNGSHDHTPSLVLLPITPRRKQITTKTENLVRDSPHRQSNKARMRLSPYSSSIFRLIFWPEPNRIKLRQDLPYFFPVRPGEKVHSQLELPRVKRGSQFAKLSQQH